ncbi:MAG: hypothetical protein Q9220_001776 [cf. Caloplaca sp. 1 TL-2023]
MSPVLHRQYDILHYFCTDFANWQQIRVMLEIKPSFNVPITETNTAATTIVMSTTSVATRQIAPSTASPQAPTTFDSSPTNSPKTIQLNVFTSTPTTTTSIGTSTHSQNGQTSIVLITSIITSAALGSVTAPADAIPPAAPAASPNSSSNAAAIGGGVGGGVAALLLLSILICCLVRRRRRRKQQEKDEATMQRPQTYLADQKEMEYMYKGQDLGTPYAGTTSTAADASPEIDGREFVPTGRPKPGEATRVDRKTTDAEAGKGHGLGPVEQGGMNGGVSELPGSMPNSRGKGDVEGKPDKWRLYEMAAADGRR